MMVFLLSDALKSAAERATLERGFRSAVEIKDHIRKSKNYKFDSSDPAHAGALLILSTRYQQTWLVATAKRLYCILDDVRKAEPHINWSMDRTAILANDGTMLIQLRSRPKTERTGLIDIGEQHKDWLFTRSLFAGSSIEERIEKLVKAQMGL